MNDLRNMTDEDRAIYWNRGISYDAYAWEVAVNDNDASAWRDFFATHGIAKLVADWIGIVHELGIADQPWRIY